jgi:hypothetical protein
MRLRHGRAIQPECACPSLKATVEVSAMPISGAAGAPRRAQRDAAASAALPAPHANMMKKIMS